jgi:outer membrane lipoprotein-sorting protein
MRFLSRPGSQLPASSLLALALLASCAHAPPKIDKADVLQRLQRNAEQRKAMAGTAFYTNKLSGKAVRAPAVVLVRWPDSLRLELQDPAGGLLGLILVSGERFWLYRHDRPEILTGPLKSFPEWQLPQGAGASDLLRIFLARPPFEKVPVTAVRDGEASFAAGGIAETILWDGKSLQPRKWTELRASGEFMEVTYDDFAFRSGAHYPGTITFSQGNDLSVIQWREWEPSVPDEQKLFQIPQQQTFGRRIKILP